MAHLHSVYDTDNHFKIDVKTRKIKSEMPNKTSVVQFDHNSERFTFELPRYIEGHDMAECNKVEVHYLNLCTETKKRATGVYTVDDLQVSPDDENIVICSWLISSGATVYAGSLSFLLRFSCLFGNEIEYAWNTGIHTEIYIASGLNTSDSFLKDYVDVIEQWKDDVMAVFTVDIEAWEKEKESELTAWKETTAVAVREEAFSDIKVQKERIEALRVFRQKKTPKVFKRFEYPEEFEGKYRPIGIYWDGANFITDFNKTDWMHSGRNIYYVSVGGSYLNDGLSRETPVQLYQAITRAADGDTIVITEGVYSIGDLPLSEYNLARSVNIIGEGNVVLVPGSRIWSDFKKDGQNGLWCAEHPLPVRVLTLDNFEITLSAASSVDNCVNTLGSYYHDGTKLYVNTNYNPNDRLLILHECIGFVCNNTEDCRLYIENITFIGGASNFQTSKSPDYDLEVILNGCSFLYGLYDRAAVRFAGGNALIVDCKVAHSRDDGFGYVAYNADSEYVETNFVEIGCVGANNGLLASVENKNGSTAHSGIKGIRVNGLYYNNFGGNVADVQEGTQTVNLGCEAYDSAAESASQGFGLQQAGATMWLYNCKANGNSADLVAYGETTAYVHKCNFDSIAGGGEIVNIE